MRWQYNDGITPRFESRCLTCGVIFEHTRDYRAYCHRVQCRRKTLKRSTNDTAIESLMKLTSDYLTASLNALDGFERMCKRLGVSLPQRKRWIRDVDGKTFGTDFHRRFQEESIRCRAKSKRKRASASTAAETISPSSPSNDSDGKPAPFAPLLSYLDTQSEIRHAHLSEGNPDAIQESREAAEERFQSIRSRLISLVPEETRLRLRSEPHAAS